MLETIAYTAIALSIVSGFLSVTSLLIHYAKRGENPLLTPVYSALDALRLAQSDLVDRVEHWQKRDSARRVREKLNDEPQPAAGATPISVTELKAQVRNAARSQGIIR